MAENELTRDEVDVIRAMADNDLNGSLAAKELFVAKSTIDYRRKTILKKTGYDIRRFYDLCMLLDDINGR